MRASRTSVASIIFVAVACAAWGGCTRKVEKDVAQQGFSLLRTERDPFYKDRADLSPVSPESILVPVADGPASQYMVRIEPEDTLELFSRWSGLSMAELVRLNPEVQHNGLVPGEWFRLVLTPGGFARLNGARNGHIAAARARKDDNVLSEVKHEVKAGESVRDLLDRYPTRMDLLEKWNRGAVQLSRLRPGQVVRVPIVSMEQRDLPLAPKPPAPPPAPLPPEPPKPLTAAPAPAPPAPAKAPAPVRVAAAVQEPAKAAGGDHPAPAKVVTYTVARGETAWEIAARHKVSRKAFVAANPGINLDRLRPGQKINLPKP